MTAADEIERLRLLLAEAAGIKLDAVNQAMGFTGGSK